MRRLSVSFRICLPRYRFKRSRRGSYSISPGRAMKDAGSPESFAQTNQSVGGHLDFRVVQGGGRHQLYRARLRPRREEVTHRLSRHLRPHSLGFSQRSLLSPGARQE